MNRFEEVGGNTNEETTAESTRKGGREVDEPKLLSPYRGSSLYDSKTRSMSETRSGQTQIGNSRGTYIMALDLGNCIGFGADTKWHVCSKQLQT
ncbi:hypothetical protein C5167_007129 [Papaver somniferum]|uniref:Uncharacterized protein n=1 Tax=Papaver somniferum TaxID=3469 RepID=A0A4Y7JH04_PAPSO|nr:hypothetical protein C5167_007129 [Papaver somniferum]